MKDMFEYNICNQADVKLFYAQCRAIEEHISGLSKGTLLDDVDGTLVQHYDHSKGVITVKNDLQVDALYVLADFDLLPYFNH